MVKCGACGKFISQTDSAKCHKCCGVYHKACVNLPAAPVVQSSWRCPECTKNVARDNRADTPVRGRSQHLNSPSEVESHNTDIPQPNSVEQVPSELISNLKKLSEELYSVRKELQLFREDMSELRSSLNRCTERMDSLEGRVAVLEQVEGNNSPSSDMSILDVITELKQELNERDQELLSNDVEINNLPESVGENPMHLASQIAIKLGISIDERDIVSAARAGAYRGSVTGADMVERRPRPLVLRLARRHLRDELLRSARVRRGVTTEGMGTPTNPQRFYVNERLTKYKRQLFRKAREAARRTGWRFVWTRHGTILARKEHGNPCCVIRTEVDIQRCFGAEMEKLN